MALALAGNPSSVHAEGRAARSLIERAREQVAALVGAKPADVFFTSGGTEANMLALTPAIETAGEKRPRERLLISAIEHSSVRAGGRFPPRRLRISRSTPTAGSNLAALARAVAEARKAAGFDHARQQRDRRGAAGRAKPPRSCMPPAGLLHVDAVQAAGTHAMRYRRARRGFADALGAQDRRAEGHRRAGAREARKFIFADPLIRGGGQERGMRAGTENVAGIAGFGAAAAAARAAGSPAEAAHIVALRNELERGLAGSRAEGGDFRRHGAERLPNTTLFALEGMKAETAVIAFDLEGVAVSSGAACSSGKVQPSHVLAAMGVSPALVRGAVRVSLGWTTTKADIERFLDAWRKVAECII